MADTAASKPVALIRCEGSTPSFRTKAAVAQMEEAQS